MDAFSRVATRLAGRQTISHQPPSRSTEAIRPLEPVLGRMRLLRQSTMGRRVII